MKSTKAASENNKKMFAMSGINISDTMHSEQYVDKTNTPLDLEKPVQQAATAGSVVDVVIERKQPARGKKYRDAGASRLRVSKKRIVTPKKKKDDDSDWEDNESDLVDDEYDLEDGDSSSDDESICAPTSDDDMCIESQKILKFPLKRTVRGLQKGQRHGRAPRLSCYPLEECGKIAGFEEFVGWVANFRTHEEKTHNNNISSVRTFMQMFADSNRPLSMRLLTSPDQIIKYIDLIKAQEHYVPKTRLQKIEALKKAIKWLKACSYRMDLPYVGGSDRDNLDCILGMLNKECNDLRPYAKADEGRCSLLSSHIAKNAFLSKEKFSELGDKLLEQLDRQHRNIADFKQLSLRKDAINDATMAYMKTLITSLFVLVPTQRAKVITLMELDDISYIPNGASINLAMEKNSYRRLHIRDVVGRHMAIPRSVSQYLQLWTQRYRRNLVIDERIMAVWVDRKGRELTSQRTSNFVRSVCSKLSGADLTPLSLRRLRTTYFVKSVQDTMGNAVAADYIAQYAAEVGQTAEILHKFYLIKDPADQVAASKLMADMSNEIIFGRKELLPEEKLQAFKPRTIASVEVARRRAEDEMKDLSDLPLLR